MTSWRATASQLTQLQLDALLDAALRRAERLTTEEGEFLPFAVTWRTGDAEPTVVMVPDDASGMGQPDPAILVHRTITLLRDERGALDAAALATDVLVDGEPSILVELEHRDGVAVGVLRGYHPKFIGNGAKLDDELDGIEGEPRIWVDDPELA